MCLKTMIQISSGRIDVNKSGLNAIIVITEYILSMLLWCVT